MTEETLEFTNVQDMINWASDALMNESKERVSQALRIFCHLLSMDPDNPHLVFGLASCYMRLDQPTTAEYLYRYCIAKDKDWAPAYNNLGFILNLDGRNEEAMENFARAAELDSTQSEYVNNIATGKVNNGTPDEAIAWANKSLALDPTSSDAKWNRALGYLEKGEWRKGWPGYQSGLRGKVTSSQQRKKRHYIQKDKHPYWDGTHGKNVVIWGEQGVGDEILGASMLGDAHRDAKIIYEAHPRLVNIMRHSFDQAFPIYGTRKVPWEALEFVNWQKIDAKLPILGLAEFYRNEDADFPRVPYLKPFDNMVDKHKEAMRKLGSRPKIGVSWKGGSTQTRRDLRSTKIEQWADLFKSFDVDWISLQYDPADKPGWNTEIVDSFKNHFGVKNLHHDPEVINDLDESYGGLIHALDLVICVNTSLVHACGAYGVPCWTLTPSRPAWRYNVPGALSIGDDKMIWYGDHVRQIRQSGDDWGAVMEIIKHDLQSYIEEVTAA